MKMKSQRGGDSEELCRGRGHRPRIRLLEKTPNPPATGVRTNVLELNVKWVIMW